MENKVPRVISRENSLYTGYNTPCGTKIVPKAKKQAHKSPFYGHLRAFCNYSNSSQRKYQQIKNADFMQHSTASISSNVTLFMSFSKTLVAN